jgi:rhodanese/phosphatase family protein
VSTPIPDSYWVEPGRLLAGEYPGAQLDADARLRLEKFAETGMTSFVDLTEVDEGLAPYEHLLPDGARYRRLAVRDLGCPSEAEMLAILDLIDEELAGGQSVYVHCWGGHGRTGTVVGCWLARHGLGGDAALRRLAELRAEVPEAAWRRSPETSAQEALVRSWHEGG